MRFLNHHYTHNSDVTTCARLKRTPVTINITNTMAHVKQKARKSTGEAPPCLHLATKAARAAAQKAIAVRKPHHWRSGRMAAREIHKLQKTTDLLIRKAPFQCLVQEIVQQVSQKVTCKCRAQLFWLSRRRQNTLWLMSSTIPACGCRTATV